MNDDGAIDLAISNWLGDDVSVLLNDCPPVCAADLDGSGDVGFADLTQLLSAWGPCAAPCPEDLDANGDVGFTDLTALLSTWGPCGV